MGISNQEERNNKLLSNIQQSIKGTDYILQIEESYLGFIEITVYYKQLLEIELNPIAVGILELLEIESPQKIEELGRFFCADDAVIYQTIQQLQNNNKIKMSNGEYIVRTEAVDHLISNIYAQTVVIDPKTKEIVNFEPHYHLPAESIIPIELRLEDFDITEIFTNLQKEQIENWNYHQVAGPRVFKVTLYDQLEKLQRKVLFDENGLVLCELEVIYANISHQLFNKKHPTSIIEFAEISHYLKQPEDEWVFIVKNELPVVVQTYIKETSLRTLVVIDPNTANEELNTAKLLELRSKGKLTVLAIEHGYDLLCVSHNNILQPIPENRVALYTDEFLAQTKLVEVHNNIIELAKKNNSQSLKAFIYLVEKHTDVEILTSIIEELANISTSNDLIHRGKILDNASYKSLAKAAYELGIQMHAREGIHS